MKAITAIYDHLAVALTTDPLLLLAAAAATFDPFWDEFEDDIDYDTDPLTIALQVTRGAFPDLYADAIERLRAGVPYAELDRLLCRGISAKGIPIDDLETIGWGIPLVALGIELEDPQFYAVHSDLLPILAPFGIDIPEGKPTTSTYRKRSVRSAARLLTACTNKPILRYSRSVGCSAGCLAAPATRWSITATRCWAKSRHSRGQKKISPSPSR
ncbi:MAG: hypothetical protein HND48_04250 [Chloroflexi bacterium]|nr:hypothetical protein [Chloroflexota bacterium]